MWIVVVVTQKVINYKVLNTQYNCLLPTKRSLTAMFLNKIPTNLNKLESARETPSSAL